MQRGRNNNLLIILGVLLVIAAAGLIFFLVTRNAGNQQATPPPDAGASTPAQQTGAAGANTPIVAGSPLSTATPVPQQISVVVAARAVNQGTILTADDVKTILKPRAEVDEAQDITDLAFAINRIITVPLNPEQVIKRRDLVEGNFSTYMQQLVRDRRLEPGKKAFAYSTNDLSAVAGLISENDLVDVVATYVFERRDTTQTDTSGVVARGTVSSGGDTFQYAVNKNIILELTTKTILQNIRVLRVIRLQQGITPVTVPRPSPTAPPNTDVAPGATPTSVVVAAPGTATPVPTLPPYQESGAQFQNSIILVLAVTDQEAEVLKFTRETRQALTASILTTGASLTISQIGGENAGASASAGGQLGVVTLGGVSLNAILTIPVVHFTLRSRPVDTTNPQDPAITIDRTSGVTYRTLVRDYGIPIPVVVFATQAQ